MNNNDDRELYVKNTILYSNLMTRMVEFYE